MNKKKTTGNAAKSKKVIIIGAGPAGLSTAYWLLKNASSNQKYDVVVLEADDHVGGISSTIKFGDGYLVDTGIHRFFSKSQLVNQLWRELLPLQNKPSFEDIILGRDYNYPSIGSNPEKDERSLLIKKRVTRIYYDGNFFEYPINLNGTTLKNLGFIKLVKIVWTYLWACIHKLPETNLENFYINCFGRELYATFFQNYTTKVWGCSPTELSADWGSQRVKGICAGDVIYNALLSLLYRKSNVKTQTSLVENFFYPKLGSGQMWQVMAQEIEKMGGKIFLNSRVTKLDTNHCINHINKVSARQVDKVLDFEVDAVVSSMPIKNLCESIGQKKMIPEVYKWAVNLPYRDFIDIYLVCNKIALPNTTAMKTVANIIPDHWIYLQDENIIAGRAQIFNNWSSYIFPNKNDIDKKFLIGLEYFTSVKDSLWQRSDKQLCALAIAEAVHLGFIDQPEDVIDCQAHRILKAYPAYCGTYVHMDEIKKQLNKFDNLYCVGRNGQHRYNNMDHSMLTGIECARLILTGSSDRSQLWRINTDKEYHESGQMHNI